MNTISIYQNGRKISAYINNNYVDSLTKQKKAQSEPVGIRIKASPKTGGRANFQKLSVWELP